MAAEGCLPRVLSQRLVQYDVKITTYVIFTCIMAGSGGLMYGYDLVIAGGISVMDDFLKKFFPDVLLKKQGHSNNYCKYNNEVFQLFTSSLYLAALTATFVASVVTRKFGRRAAMLAAGIFFISGTILGTSAQNLYMLITARVLLGCGIGFSNHAVPVYLSEIAPPRLRGGLNLLFSVYATVGIFSGNIVNYMALSIPHWGWRFSLGMAGVPALMITLCSLLVVETPGSLLERGRFDEAKVVLRKIRGTQNIEAEYEDLLNASKSVDEFKNPFRELLARRRRPQLVLACAFPFFQQAAGNDAILFYGAFFFKTAKFGDHAALYSAVITGASAFIGGCTAIFVVDRVGRRRLLLVGSTFMCISLVALASIFATKVKGDSDESNLSLTFGAVEVALVCMFVLSFNVSLGPLAWLIPSEIWEQDVRSAGQSVTVFVNMTFKFLIAQTLLSMLCAFKWGTFLFFAFWVMCLGVFILLFLPETKHIALHKISSLWQKHWYWRRFVPSIPIQYSVL